MSTTSISGGNPTSGPTALATRLNDLAIMAEAASKKVHVDYLSDPSTVTRDLKYGGQRANKVIEGLEALLPDIAVHGGGNDGLKLADRAIEQLRTGMGALKTGIGFGDGVTRASSAVIINEHAPKVAESMFGKAASSLHGMADIAGFRGLTDDAFQAAVKLLR
jgi:hypothetical protein